MRLKPLIHLSGARYFNPRGGVGDRTGLRAGKHDARTRGKYHKGMATFTIAKGGLMLDASVAGQRFSWYPAS